MRSNRRNLVARASLAFSLLLNGQPVFADPSIVPPTSPSPETTQTTPASPLPSIIDASTYQGNELSVGSGQTLILDFSNGSTLSLSGNITNSGQIYAISNNPNISSAIFSALNITNQQGAIFSSVIPTSGLIGLGNYGNLSNLSLVLNAVQNVTNYGSITSAANLSVNAGGSIVNALPSGLTGLMPVMQAMGSLNLTSQAGNITNAGLLSSVGNNVSINTMVQNLLVTNVGGRIEALNGQINIGNILSSANLSVLGGDLLSRELNVLTGAHGVIDVNANSISGLVNAVGCDLGIGTVVGGLNINSLDLSGDPIIYSHADGVAINLNGFSGLFNTGGSDFVVLSGGDINYSGGGSTVNATNSKGSGGNITLAAGVTFDPIAGASPVTCSTCAYKITGESNSGGSINAGTLSLHTNSSEVFLVSSKGTGGVNAGNISIGNIDTSGNNATAAGAAGGAAGNIKVISAGALTIGSLRAAGGNGLSFTGNNGAGGAGGAGGNIMLGSNTTANIGNIFVNGGNGGNGGKGSATGAAGGAGGAGGSAGTLNLFINSGSIGSIKAVGGNAGSGGHGGLGSSGSTGGAGGAAGAGGAGGSLSVSGTDFTLGPVNVSGGNAGSAGDGGEGGRGAPGGRGGLGPGGGVGGSAGVLNLTGTTIKTEELTGNGGAGGNGGNGGQSGGTNRDGGDGGDGGAGGAGSQLITSSKVSLTFGDISFNGGNAGTGGSGGRAGSSFVLISAGDAGHGGAGGAGGSGGALDLSSGSINLGNVTASGGKGAAGGNGGIGGAMTGDNLSGRAGDGGFGGVGGVGGSTGLISIKGASLTSGNMVLIGGAGGSGGNGGTGGDTYALSQVFTRTGHGGNAGAGGGGGAASLVDINVSGAVNFVHGGILLAGGDGSNGGVGGAGGRNITTSQIRSTTGNGGNGGAGGAGGAVSGLDLRSGSASFDRIVSLKGGNGGTGFQGGQAGDVYTANNTLGDAGNGGIGGGGGVGGSVTGILSLKANSGNLTLKAGSSIIGGTGGDGAYGGAGGSGVQASGDGGLAGNGGAGGDTHNLSLFASGDILSQAELRSSSGNGGRGGIGGNGGYAAVAIFSHGGDAGRGGDGGNGGRAGAFVFSSTNGIISTTTLHLSSGNGGASGNGGNGGAALASLPRGGNGGASGNAGAGGALLSAQSVDITALGNVTLGSMTVKAGAGGDSGQGGQAGIAISVGGQGGNGGLGGLGASLGSINVRSTGGALLINAFDVSAGNGGHGGAGGANAKGALSTSSPGSGGTGGAGGSVGSINLAANTKLTLPGAFSVSAGNGGVGGTGASDISISVDGASGGAGRDGGAGGSLGDITLQGNTILIQSSFAIRGGKGADGGIGGTGGRGTNGGNGGNGGQGGAGGNTAALSILATESLDMLSTLSVSGGDGGNGSHGGSGGSSIQGTKGATGGDGGNGGSTGILLLKSNNASVQTKDISITAGVGGSGAYSGDGGGGFIGKQGANGGSGGHGGSTGSNTVQAGSNITLGLFSNTGGSGGQGQAAGRGGNGLSSGDGGKGGSGGDGGVTGATTLSANGSIIVSSLSSVGGKGGSAFNGASGGSPTIANGGNGGHGGNGGSGGNANGFAISTGDTFRITSGGITVAGGAGAAGGNGGIPSYAVLAAGGNGGSGGNGGTGGRSGSIEINAGIGSISAGLPVTSIGGAAGNGGAGIGGAYGTTNSGNGGRGGAGGVGGASSDISLKAGTSISVNLVSSAAGASGNGGNGGNTGASDLNVSGAGPGGNGGQGSTSGAITLLSGTGLSATDINTLGGLGGSGGIGGTASIVYNGSPGGGASGGLAGNGGNTGSIAITAGTSFASNSVTARGGKGGTGGGGGAGGDSGVANAGVGASGSAGGNGGTAGTIGIFAGTSAIINGDLHSIGGAGGDGGFGGGGGSGTFSGRSGAIGGRGGNAGSGAAISLLAGDTVRVNGAVQSRGGDGGQGGGGGNGGSGLFSPGDGSNSGGGGDGFLPGQSGTPGRGHHDGLKGPAGNYVPGTGDVVVEGSSIYVGFKVLGSSVSMITGAGTGSLTLVKPRAAETNTGVYSANGLNVGASGQFGGGMLQTNQIVLAQNFNGQLDLSNISSGGGSISVGPNNLFQSGSTYSSGQADFVALSSGNIVASGAPANANITTSNAHIILGSGQAAESVQAKVFVIGVNRSTSGGNIELTPPNSANAVALNNPTGGLVFLNALGGSTASGSVASGALTARQANSVGLAAVSANSNLNVSGTSTAGFVLLSSAKGNIGVAGTPFVMNATHLSVIAKGGSANILNSAPVSGIFNSFSSGNFDYTNNSAGGRTYVGGGVPYTSNYGILSTGDITLVADNITLGAPIKAQNVTLHPYSNNVQIGVAGAAGAFQVSAFSLGQITASNLIIGSKTQSGGINLGSYTATASGAGSYKITLNNTGAVSQSTNSTFSALGISVNAASLSLGANSKLIASTQDISIDKVPAGSPLVVTLASGAQIISTVGDAKFQDAAAGAITINSGLGSISAAKSIVFNGGAGAIEVKTDSLSGSVKASGASVAIATNQGQLKTGVISSTNGATTLSANGGELLIGGSLTGSGGKMTLTGNKGVSINAAVSNTFTPLTLGTLSIVSGSNSAVALNANVTSNNDLVIQSGAAITHSQGTLSADSVSLNAKNGSVGSGPQGSSSNVLVDANSIELNGSSAFINSVKSIKVGNVTLANNGTFNLITQNNGDISITGAVSAPGTLSTVILSADGSGNILFPGSSTLTANTVELDSGSGNIGVAGTPLRTAAANLRVNNGGTGVVYVENVGPVNIGQSSAGTILSISSSGSITSTSDIRADQIEIISEQNVSVKYLVALNGNLSVTAGTNPTSAAKLTVLSNGIIFANEGNTVLRNLDATNGTILIDSNAVVSARTTGATKGQVQIFLGASYSPDFGPAPAQNVSETNIGGLILYGTNSITANGPPTNSIISVNGLVGFNTGTRAASAITLNGGSVVASFGKQAPLVQLKSLDLSNSIVVNEIQQLQNAGIVGGKLTYVAGVLTGNAIISPENLYHDGLNSIQLSAENVLNGVTLSFVSFTKSDAINYTLDASSTTKQVIITGAHEFTGSRSTNGVMNITSNQSGPTLLLNPTGTLSSSGTLSITANGSMQLSGTVNSQYLNLSTSNDGSIILQGAINADKTANLSVDGLGTISQVGGAALLRSENIVLVSSKGNIGGLAPINISASTVSAKSAFASVSLVDRGDATRPINSLKILESSTGTGMSFSLSTLNSGSLDIGGDIKTGGMIFLSAPGGNITRSQSVGTLFADSYRLTAGGTVGNYLFGPAIQVGAGFVTVNAGLGASIEGTGDFNLLSSSVGGVGLRLRADSGTIGIALGHTVSATSVDLTARGVNNNGAINTILGIVMNGASGSFNLAGNGALSPGFVPVVLVNSATTTLADGLNLTINGGSILFDATEVIGAAAGTARISAHSGSINFASLGTTSLKSAGAATTMIFQAPTTNITGLSTSFGAGTQVQATGAVNVFSLLGPVSFAQGSSLETTGTSGGNTISISALAALNLQVEGGGSASLKTANGSINVSPLFGPTLITSSTSTTGTFNIVNSTLQVASKNGFDIIVGANIVSNKQASFVASGAGNILADPFLSSIPVISASAINLSSQTGNIAVATATPELQAKTGGTGSVVISQRGGPINVTNSEAGLLFSVQSSGATDASISTTGILIAPIVSLSAGGVNSSITLNGPVFARVATNLKSSGSGNISNGLNMIFSPLLNVESPGGDVTLRTASSLINLTASRRVDIANIGFDLVLNNTTPNLLNFSLSNDRAVTVLNTLDLSAVGTAGNITILAGGAIQTNDLNTDGLLGGGNISLTSGSSITAGAIQTRSMLLNSGKISIIAGNSIQTNSLNTGAGGKGGDIYVVGLGSVTTGIVNSTGQNGGNIAITSYGSLLVGDVSSNASNNGGTVNLFALTTLTGSNINASTTGFGNGGNIFVTAGQAITLGAVSSKATNAASAANGGTVFLTSGNTLALQNADVSAAGIGNGGFLAVAAGQLTVTGTNASGNSLDASSAGRGGILIVSSGSSDEFFIGGGTGSNRIAGNLVASGATDGGILAIVSAPKTTVMAGAQIRADGGTGLGGSISLVSNGMSMLATVDGVISARNNADTSGNISFVVPLCTPLTLTGSGTVHAGSTVNVGHLVANPIDVSVASIGNVVLKTPCPNCFPTPTPPAPAVIPETKHGPQISFLGIANALQGVSLGLGERVPTDTLNRAFGVADDDAPGQVSSNTGSSQTGGMLLQGNLIFDQPLLSQALANGVVLDKDTVITNPRHGRDLQPNSFAFQKGTLILAPQNDVIVHVGNLNLKIGAGSIVLIYGDGDSTSILNLFDKHNSAVKLGLDNEELTLAPGHQFIVSHDQQGKLKSQKIAYRNRQKTAFKNNVVYSSEFSLSSAFSNITLLKGLLSGANRNPVLASKILKTAAAMHFVKAQKPFTNQ